MFTKTKKHWLYKILVLQRDLKANETSFPGGEKPTTAVKRETFL